MATHDNQIPSDDRLKTLQENIKDALGETTFGNPVKITAPGGQTIVYRKRHYEGRPEAASYELSRAESRKAVSKRSKAMGESWKKFNSPGKRSLLERDDSPKSKYPLAYELVEYVNGGGTVNNVANIMQLKPPTIHGIEDVADAVDWHFLNRGINVEHIETALNKDGSKVLVFMDDRAKPRLPQIKEVLNKFGAARILQRADGISEETGQPHGFFVFELEPDNSIYQPSNDADPNPKSADWQPDTPQPNMVDSLEDDNVEVILENHFEPYCSTCGIQLFEADQRIAFKPSQKLADKKWQERQKVQAKAKSAWKKTDFAAESLDETDSQAEMAAKVKLGKKAKKLDKKGVPHPAGNGTTFNMHNAHKVSVSEADLDEMCGAKHGKKKLPRKFIKNMSSEAFDAKVGDPKGKKKKDHPSTLGDALEVACSECHTDATPIDEHEFKGYYCARHGDRLDKYSRACFECREEQRVLENMVVACPECKTTTSLEEDECGVCGTIFDEGVSDYAEYVAETIAPYVVDEDVTQLEQDWSDSLASRLADSLFADVEEDDDLPF